MALKRSLIRTKEKKELQENTKVWDWLQTMEQELLAGYEEEEEEIIIESD